MAITKLMHMKEARGGTKSSHLKNALQYILNPEKTEQGLLIGGNVGTDANEIHEQMLATKQLFGKEQGRQGYHFVVSFDRFEASQEDAMKVGETFARKYFGDHYEYVSAVHNDKEHMHVHFIFNSVSRSDGKKFQYKNGDWEKLIQPQVDQACIEHGLKPLEYDKSKARVGIHYIEKENKELQRTSKRSILKSEIDYIIERTNSFPEFISEMKQREYEIRYGQSKKHGDYFTILEGNEKGIRNYTLGAGYTVDDIQKRIFESKIIISKNKKLKYTKLVKKLKQPSHYQKIRICYMVRVQLYPAYGLSKQSSKYGKNASAIRKSKQNISRLRAATRYMVQNKIQSKEACQQRLEFVTMQERKLYNQRKEKNHLKENIEDIQDQLKKLRYEKKLLKEVAEGVPTSAIRKENYGIRREINRTQSL